MATAQWERDHKPKRPPRRELCLAAGNRAEKLNPAQAASAWLVLAIRLQNLQDQDIPKFKDLFDAIRHATIIGRTRGNR